MSDKLDHKRPLNHSVIRRPTLRKSTGSTVGDIIALLILSTRHARSLPVHERVAVFPGILAAVLDKVVEKKKVVMTISGPDDPLAVFLAQLVAVDEIFDASTIDTALHQLHKVDWCEPPGLDLSGDRSLPLLALHGLLEVIAQTFTELAGDDGMPGPLTLLS